MWWAFPTSDYYGGSASLSGIGVALPYHPIQAFPRLHAGLKRMEEVADRNLYPCMLQVGAPGTD